MSVTFSTPHPFDFRALTIMGINSKPNTDSPIGFFGTGLKYAVAVLTRLGCSITFKSDGRDHKVSLSSTTFRGKSFETLRLNGKDLPFTTEYGKTWTALTAYRELVTNTWDEGGEILDGLHPRSFGLQILVEGKAIDEARASHDKMFLPPLPILDKSPGLEIYSSPSSSLFYRGVAVQSLMHPSQVTYNLLSEQKLTEDRTLASLWSAQWDIAAYLSHTDKEVLWPLLGVPQEQTFEASFDPHTNISAKFASWLIARFERGEKVNEKLVVSAFKLLGKSRKRDTIAISPRWETMLQDAKAVLLAYGFDLTPYPVSVVEHLESAHAVADCREKTITLAASVFRQGETFLLSTLLEEYLHLRFSLHDETRAMQDWLLNFAADLMLDRKEERKDRE